MTDKEKEKEPVQVVERDERGRWKPGSVPNPIGLRASIPKEIREGRKILQNDFEHIAQQISKMNQIEFARLQASPKATLWELLVASMFEKSINGSAPHAQELLNRTIGKPKETIEFQTPLEERIKNLSQEERHELLRKYIGRIAERSKPDGSGTE